jgi:hypothetical protein
LLANATKETQSIAQEASNEEPPSVKDFANRTSVTPGMLSLKSRIANGIPEFRIRIRWLEHTVLAQVTRLKSLMSRQSVTSASYMASYKAGCRSVHRRVACYHGSSSCHQDAREPKSFLESPYVFKYN